MRGRLRLWSRIFGLSLATAALAGACLTPTQITVHVTTNAACDEAAQADRFVELAIAAGAPENIAEQAPAGTTSKCISLTTDLGAGFGPNDLGTLVLVPEGSKDEGLEVVAVAAIKSLAGQEVSLNDCLDWVATGMPANGCRNANDADTTKPVIPCLLARRRLGFVPHLKLELPIQLDTFCAGVFCGPGSTCVNQQCVSDVTMCTEGDPTCDLGSGGGGGTSSSSGVMTTGSSGGSPPSSSGVNSGGMGGMSVTGSQASSSDASSSDASSSVTTNVSSSNSSGASSSNSSGVSSSGVSSSSGMCTCTTCGLGEICNFTNDCTCECNSAFCNTQCPFGGDCTGPGGSCMCNTGSSSGVGGSSASGMGGMSPTSSSSGCTCGACPLGTTCNPACMCQCDMALCATSAIPCPPGNSPACTDMFTCGCQCSSGCGPYCASMGKTASCNTGLCQCL